MSQEVSPFPTGDHKAARNRHGSMTKTNTNNKKDPQKKQRLERSVRKSLEGLKMFDVTKLTLFSDVYQDTQMIGLHKKIPNVSMNHPLLHVSLGMI